MGRNSHPFALSLPLCVNFYFPDIVLIERPLCTSVPAILTSTLFCAFDEDIAETISPPHPPLPSPTPTFLRPGKTTLQPLLQIASKLPRPKAPPGWSLSSPEPGQESIVYFVCVSYSPHISPSTQPRSIGEELNGGRSSVPHKTTPNPLNFFCVEWCLFQSRRSQAR